MWLMTTLVLLATPLAACCLGRLAGLNRRLAREDPITGFSAAAVRPGTAPVLHPAAQRALVGS